MITGTWCSAPKPAGASGKLEKEQALPHVEKLFSQYGVRPGECGGTSHQQSPVHAELPEFLQRQDGGTTETLSEAPGAYGIRSLVTRIALYETTSQHRLRSQFPSWSWHHGKIRVTTPLIQPLDGPCLSTGRSSLRTSVSACRCHNGCLPCRWCATCSLGVLDRASTALAHPSAAAWLACVGPHGHNQLAGLSTIMSHVITRLPSPPLESEAAQVAARRPHPGGAQSCSRCALTTAHVS